MTVLKPKVAIMDQFFDAFSNVARDQQKKVREFIQLFRNNPTAASINYEKIHGTKDDRVRTVRIDQKYRAVVLHPDQGNVYLLVWVDNHDEAMAWAMNKQFEVNPSSGSLQVYDTQIVQKVVQEQQEIEAEKKLADYHLFETFTDEQLVESGLPAPLIPSIRVLKKVEDLDGLQPYLPSESYDVLWYIVNLGYSVQQALNEAMVTKVAGVNTEDIESALEHPDTQRRFVVVRSADELTEMLNAPLEKWRTFLHPSQARLVSKHFNGPARVLGGAGTGKTVVAMHRARYLAAELFNKESDRILVTTFTRNLANNIRENLIHLCGREMERIEVVNLHQWAYHFLLEQGYKISIASREELNECWERAVLLAEEPEQTGHLDEDFYAEEWEHVVQFNGIQTKQEYLRVSRRGQDVRLNRKQKAAVWNIFTEYKRALQALGKMEWDDTISQARMLLEEKGPILPYQAIVVDETQDLTKEELRLLRQMVPEQPNDLFFAGDAHQRIYSRPIAMSHCGINIRGRGHKLNINYRTTDEIKRWAVSILKDKKIDDLDGESDDLIGYRSLLHGNPPEINQFDSIEEEIAYLKETIELLLLEGVPANGICIVSRYTKMVKQYLAAFEDAGFATLLLQSRTSIDSGSGIRFGTMHRVKGLEFNYMFITAVNDGIMPPARYDDENMDDLMERCLLYVAATRARDSLRISSYGKPSRFLGKGEREG